MCTHFYHRNRDSDSSINKRKDTSRNNDDNDDRMVIRM